MKIRGLLNGVSAAALVIGGFAVATSARAATEDQAANPSPSDNVAAKPDAKVDEGKKTEAIIVTARRKALQTSEAIKRLSDTIVDSVTADDAGKLPDNSVTEVLQRVSGVSISRFTGTNGGSTAFQIEGTGLTVRGLPYNSSTLNGEQLFSANGASAISWNEVTPELMAGVDVYKASRADMIEGGASSIDLRTRLPFDYKKTEFDVTIGGSYGSQVEKGSPNISALYTKRFDTGIGEIGILWDLAYGRLYQQSSDLTVGAMFGEYSPTATRPDGIAFVPSSFNWSYNQNKRDRYGVYQAIQWKPTSNLTITNTVFFNEYVADSYGTSAVVGVNPSGAAEILPEVGAPVQYDANGAFQKGTLVLGSTGDVIPYTNSTVGLSWPPAPYNNLSCGSLYGTPPSSLEWNWGSNPYAPVSATNPPYAACSPGDTALNPTGGATASHTKNSTLDVSQSFVWTPSDRLSVRGGVQYVYSRATGQTMYVGISQTSSQVSSMNVDLSGSLPSVSGLSTAGLLDPASANFFSMGYHSTNNTGQMFAGHVDADYKVSDDGFLRRVVAGVRIDNRTEDDSNPGTYYVPLGVSYLNAPGTNNPNTQYFSSGVNPADYTASSFPNFFGGRVSVPGQLFVPSQALMQSYNWYYLAQTYNRQIPNGTAAQYWNTDFDQGESATQSRIFNAAAYVEARFASDGVGSIPRFSGNIGLRVFHDTLHASGLLYEPANTGQYALTAADSTNYFNLQNGLSSGGAYPTLYSLSGASIMQYRDYGYTRFLPSFNIKFDVDPKFVIRAAASESSSPPNLNDIRAGGIITANSVANPTNSQAPSILSGVTVNSGGFTMKPVMITSEDISFEYYPASSSLFYVDLFAKQIKDQELFNSFVNDAPVPLLAVAGGPGGTSSLTSSNLPYVYLQNQTSSALAYMKGFEVGGRTFFDKLPGVFKGLGVEGNLTFIDSHNPAQEANNVLSPMTANGGLNANGTVPQTYPNLPYAGLSKWAYNIQLLYSRDKLNFRLAYNWRDKALLSTNVNPLSYATSGGNPYILNTSGTNFGPTASYPVYNMVPAWTAAVGYLDFGFDYRASETLSISFHASNILNTISRTLQEPVPGVFEPYDYNVSDRRYDLSLRLKFR